MPVARSASIHSSAAGTGAGGAVPVGGAGGAPAPAADAGGDGDNDNDNDDRTYCFCDGVSYGEMIACDDVRCEREWVSGFLYMLCSVAHFWLFKFHLACIGLTVPPEGTWFCEACKNKKPVKRTVRGGKRRTAAARA